MTDDEWVKSLFKEVENIVAIKDKAAVGRLKRGLRKAMRIVDKASQAEYKSHRYRFGSTKEQRRDRGGTFRDFAKRATAYRYRFNVARGRRPWRYQSMMKRKGRDNVYQGNLSHLLEDGSYNFRTGRKNHAYQVRLAAFNKSASAARAQAIRAFEEAILGGS